MSAYGFGPTLALRARRASGAAFDFSAGLPAGASLVRSSMATRIDATGRLASEAANVARLDYDPLALTPRGLLIEPATPNLALAGEAFDAAAWSKFNATISADAATSPAGTATADRMIEAAIMGQHRVTQAVSTTNGQVLALSLYVKAAERSRLWLRFTGAGTFAQATVNLAAKTVTGVIGSAALIEQANGWFRVSVGGAADATSVTATVNMLDDAGTLNYTGSTANGMLLWGAQFEAGGATSYIAATREADALTLDWGAKGVADGVATVRYTFDDGSTQDVATTIAGGTATVPTTLARPRVRRAALL